MMCTHLKRERTCSHAALFTLHTDISTAISIAKANYHYDHLNACIKLCDYVQLNTTEGSSESNIVKLLKGKTLCHIYQKEQRYLNTSALPAKEHYLRHTSCYSKTMEAIALLGTAFDCNCLDNEAAQLLDQAMIDHLKQVNSKDRQRCLLCRKKRKLCRSHSWPKAMFEAFASGLRSDRTHKLFDREEFGDSKAAGQLTSWMLCADCEAMLSSQAESQFIKKFFFKVYDINSPTSDQPQLSQTIEYNEWLYCFCISMVFRGLVAIGFQGHGNDDKIYQLFCQCREFLLKSPSDRNTAPIGIALLMSPTKGSDNDQTYGFFHQVLHMPGLFILSKTSLLSGVYEVPRKAKFFLAHSGVINILVNVADNKPGCISSNFYISCQDGQYLVLADE